MITLKNNQQVTIKDYDYPNMITIHTTSTSVHDTKVWALKHPNIEDTEIVKEATAKAVKLAEGDIVMVEGEKYKVTINIKYGPIIFDPVWSETVCFSEGTKVLAPIKNLKTIKDTVSFEIGKISIQASKKHIFKINWNKVTEAGNLKNGDMLSVDISLLSSYSRI